MQSSLQAGPSNGSYTQEIMPLQQVAEGIYELSNALSTSSSSEVIPLNLRILRNLLRPATNLIEANGIELIFNFILLFSIFLVIFYFIKICGMGSQLYELNLFRGLNFGSMSLSIIVIYILGASMLAESNSNLSNLFTEQRGLIVILFLINILLIFSQIGEFVLEIIPFKYLDLLNAISIASLLSFIFYLFSKGKPLSPSIMLFGLWTIILMIFDFGPIKIYQSTQ